MSDPTLTKRRSLSLLDLVCLGCNSVIGSGLFVSMGEIGSHLGAVAPAMFLACGLACVPIALCFCEMAQEDVETGGAYRYATRGFGREVGFLVGFVMWMSGLLGAASVAVGLEKVLDRPGVALATVIVLAILNERGAVMGAWTNNILNFCKLAPILALAGYGLTHFGGPGLAAPPVATDFKFNLLLGVLGILYTFSGFEEVALPSGEVRDPQRMVPRALLIVMALSTTLYAIIQATLMNLSQGRPFQLLTEVTGDLGGLTQAIGFASLASFLSVNASIAFTTPRSLWALASDGWLPARLAWLHPVRQTPGLAILVSTSLTCLLVVSNSLEKLILASVLASLVQQLSTTLACGRVRGWRVRFASPILGTAVCLLLLGTSEPAQIGAMLAAMLVGWLISRVTRRKTTGEASP